MELRQRLQLKRRLAPQLRHSLKILTLPLSDLKNLVQQELTSNPILEEICGPENTPKTTPPSLSKTEKIDSEYLDFRLNSLTENASLQDILLRQLGIFTNTDEELKIGQEIIGNIDENGYLKAGLDELSLTLNMPAEKVENVLKIIQQFDPPGVCARSIQECLLIQLKLADQADPLAARIIENHLEDVAKKNYGRICKALKEPLEKVELAVKKIQHLDPKPGRNYSPEEVQRVIPDIIIEEKGENLEISISNADIPEIRVNPSYSGLLDKLAGGHDQQAKEFLSNKLNDAMEFLRSISKRQATLKKVVEAIVEIQREAVQNGLSHLKPITLHEIAQKVEMHESTVSRAVMNKYVQLPWGIAPLKSFFTSHVHGKNGESVSSSHIKGLIQEYIDNEDKKQPLSDDEISKLLLNEKNLRVSRRTVAKYREELKILSSPYRKD
ncbi:MAG: RNA polymerase factor sigma-54 [Candidatus Omnitrophica bacterium]|nr:RNA polymerase factor sigma-54 [Candidatus Omnitrophota bacterium]MDD5553813.1 RNA polymerase factor sigma-54 [Candidatus Omnitrophota bacterium]